MDPMRTRGKYFHIFLDHATKLCSYPIALDWYRIDVGHADGVTALEAAAWASAGYLPHEARPLIMQGVTVEMAIEIEAIDRGELTPEEYAMKVLDRLYADGRIRQARPGEISE